MIASGMGGNLAPQRPFKRAAPISNGKLDVWTALTDSLTGLANRRAFNGRLAEEIAHADRYGTELTLAMLDLDHFKAYKDTHGHVAGDHALDRVASALQRLMRDSDIAFRYGGEEFAILMAHTGVAEAARVTSRMLTNFRTEEHLSTPGAGEQCLTLSAGVAPHTPGQQATSFIESADAALYAAKRAGRNRCVSLAA